MRVRLFFLGASATMIAGALAVQACGGEEETAPAADAGVEAAPEAAPRDTGAPDTGVDSGPPCDTNADFTDNIPDASIADGASTTGVCVACAKSKCGQEVDDCNKDCPCQEVADQALDCFAKGNSVLQCAASFASVPQKTQQIGLALFSCLNDECATECATSSFLDAGADADAGDGG